MKKKLKHYEKVIGSKATEKIRNDAQPLENSHIVNINSTLYGGGVAEILTNLVMLMNDVGIQTGWRVLKGSPEFFTVTKKFHNALQGEKINLSRAKKKVYLDYNEINSTFTHFDHHDAVIVHDLQPLPFIKYQKKRQPWIWRCHVDLSSPYPALWKYFKKFISNYDAMVVSTNKFCKPVKTPTHIIPPSIDPLSSKNEPVSDTKMHRFLAKKGVDMDKPIISQISRFDKWKDPVGVIRSFELIKEKFDCKLVLLGSFATDDPEGPEIYRRVADLASTNEDIIVITEENDFLVNTLQRASDVVIQKSLKEGFALTVSEALWKETPVVAGRAGGIPLQVLPGKTGYLVDDVQGCAKATLKLLQNPRLAKRLGKQGKEHVRKNFLITRHLTDYLRLLKSKDVGLLK